MEKGFQKRNINTNQFLKSYILCFLYDNYLENIYNTLFFEYISNIYIYSFYKTLIKFKL